MITMPKQHEEKLHRMSFRIDDPTLRRLDKLAKHLAARDADPTPNRTRAIRYAAQLADAFDEETMDNATRIIAKLGGRDASGAPALSQAIKFALRIAAKAAGPVRGDAT